VCVNILATDIRNELRIPIPFRVEDDATFSDLVGAAKMISFVPHDGRPSSCFAPRAPLGARSFTDALGNRRSAWVKLSHFGKRLRLSIEDGAGAPRAGPPHFKAAVFALFDPQSAAFAKRLPLDLDTSSNAFCIARRTSAAVKGPDFVFGAKTFTPS
jgi:hypothetical protein